MGQEIYIKAWVELDKERERSTERVFPITRRMVMDWLEWHDIRNDPEFKDTLLQVVQAIDALYLPKELTKLNARKKREASKEKRRAKRAGR